jgi:spore coat polysaccharide biosynthesis protein SpsF (cytidylyltransferase family)
VHGSEHDVLSRYVTAGRLTGAHFIARLTGDCPLIPPGIISKQINIARMNNYDYLDNCHPHFRTTPDGYDVEVMSARMLAWLCENAESADDREHVTILLRRQSPEWARMNTTVSDVDMSQMKLSVDTPEDLEIVRKNYMSVQSKEKGAKDFYDQKTLHWY